jgi:hypothetical protein
MLTPLIRHSRQNAQPRSNERGFTMALVALAMVALIAMAALSIDIGSLYEFKAEAQRSADLAALTAVRVISISGITGDPANVTASWQPVCGGATSLASVAATNIAAQNLIAGRAPSTVNVYYGTNAGVGTNADCTAAGSAFGVNPVIKVYVQQATLPTFFSRIFSLIPGGTSANSGVSATAVAEAFNPSGSGALSSGMVPVQPRCVKPWIVPNEDPGNGTCTPATCPSFVDPATGAITKPGTLTGNNGVIGETFNLFVDCGRTRGRRGPCTPYDNPPVANGDGGGGTLDYVPGQVLQPSIAIAANSAISGCSEAKFNDYTKAVAGCDQTTIYACGNSGANPNLVDLSEDPGPRRNDSVNAAQCLINASGSGAGNGQDSFISGPPFQLLAGANSALLAAGLASGSQITSSPSIVSVPIYDSTAAVPHPLNAPPGTTPVTIVGFLQVFINYADSTSGNINVTVMNVAGCSNNTSTSPVFGTSPVPVRLITPP